MRYLLVLLIALPLFAASQPTGEVVDKVIGVVGDEIVLYSELQAILLDAKEQGQRITDKDVCAAFENLMYQKLLLNQAKLDSVVVADAEVQQQVDRRISYFLSMFGSTEEFEAFYGKSMSQLKEEYFDMIKDQLLIQKKQEEITKDVKTTPSDVLKLYNSLPIDSLPLIGEQLQYSIIEIDPIIRESEVQRVIHVMDSIRGDIMAGRTSMTVQAVRWSEDPGSKYKGGCYPMQRKGSFVPEYEAAVFAAAEGTYTPVFKSSYGYHFVKVSQKRGEYYESCHILMSPKVYDVDLDSAKFKADTLYRALLENKYSFRAAAMRFSMDKDSKNQEGRVMNMYSGGIKHDVADLTPEVNLILSNLKPGEFSEPVLVTKQDGSKCYIIYRLDDRVNAHRASMELDYEIFQARTDGELKQAELDKWVKKTVAKTFNKMSPEYANCTYQFGWVTEVK